MLSSLLFFFIHASDTGHAEGVPIAPSRGGSVEFTFEKEPPNNQVSILEKYRGLRMQVPKLTPQTAGQSLAMQSTVMIETCMSPARTSSPNIK